MMNKRTDRINDGKGSISRSAADRQHDEQQEVQLEDKRPVAIAQRKIQSTIDYSSSHTSEKQAAYSYHPVQLSEDGTGGSDGKKGETKQSEGGKETKQEAQSSDGAGEKKGLSLEKMGPIVDEVMKTRLRGMISSPQSVTRTGKGEHETIDINMSTAEVTTFLSTTLGVPVEIKELRIHLHGPGSDDDRVDFKDTDGFHFGRTWVTWKVEGMEQYRTCELMQNDVKRQVEALELLRLYNFGNDSKNLKASAFTLEELLEWVQSDATNTEIQGKDVWFTWTLGLHKLTVVKKENGNIVVNYKLNKSNVYIEGINSLIAALQDKLTPPPPSTTQSPTPPQAVG